MVVFMNSMHVTEGEEILSGESVKIINTENKILIVEKFKLI